MAEQVYGQNGKDIILIILKYYGMDQMNENVEENKIVVQCWKMKRFWLSIEGPNGVHKMITGLHIYVDIFDLS